MGLKYGFLVLVLILVGCSQDTDTYYTDNKLVEARDERVISSDPKEKKHTVVTGDTLVSIARQYNTSAEAIRKKNNLRDDSIHHGQVLIIPQSYISTTTPELPKKSMEIPDDEMLKAVRKIKDDQSIIKNLIADISNRIPKDMKPSSWKSIINIATGSFIGVAILIGLWLGFEKLYRIMRKIPENNEPQKLATEISNKIIRNPHINQVKNELVREIIGIGYPPINFKQLYNELNTLKDNINYLINTINRIESDISLLKERSLTPTESDKVESALKDKIESPDKQPLPYLDDSGKLVGYDRSSARYKAKREKPLDGFGIGEKIFEEDIDGNYVIIPDQYAPEKGTCYPLDTSSLESGDLIYPLEKSENTKGWKIERYAKCKKVGNNWVLDGVEGKIKSSTG